MDRSARLRSDGLVVHLRVTLPLGARMFVTESIRRQAQRRLNPAMFRRRHQFRAMGSVFRHVPPPGKDVLRPDPHNDDRSD